MTLEAPAAPIFRRLVTGTVRAGVEELGGRPAMVVRSVSTLRRGALSIEDGETMRVAAEAALALRIPMVMVLASSGADVSDGVASLHGWGRAAHALAMCSGTVPVVTVVTGPALSGPALLLGIADLVVMTTDAFAFVSGPAMVEEFTGVRIGIHQLGGTPMHARSSGLCAIEASSEVDAMAHVDHLLGLLPANADELAPRSPVGHADLDRRAALSTRKRRPCPSGTLLEISLRQISTEARRPESVRGAKGYQLKLPFPVSRSIDPQENGNGKHSLCSSGG